MLVFNLFVYQQCLFHKIRILLWWREEEYKEIGEQQILFIRTRTNEKNTINEAEHSSLSTYLKGKFFEKKSHALYQIKVKCLILSHKLVRKFVIKDARIMLQPNTPNNGIDCMLPQRFGFFPFPKTGKFFFLFFLV